MAEEMELMESGVESDGGASNEVAPAESQDAGQRQPAQQAVDYARLDLSQLPQFREYQSRADQRLAQLEREAHQARQEAQQARMAGMDDYERVQYERDMYANQYQTLAQQLEQERAMQIAIQQRDMTLRRISQEMGVPVSELDPSGPDAAWRSAALYLQRKGQAAAPTAAGQQEPATRANVVDLGGGSPQTADARYRAQLNNLRNKKAPAEDIYKLMLGNS